MLGYPRIRNGGKVRAGAAGLAVVLACSRASAQPAPAAASARLTVAQAIDEAVAHNLDLIARRADVPIAEARLVTAGLRPNPVFSADADHLDLLGTRFNDQNNGGPREFGLRVDLPIERGAKRERRVDEAEIDRSLAAARVEDAIRQLRESVELACADIVLASDNLAVARDTEQTFERLASLNDDRVRAGAAAPYEATRTRVALLQFRATVTRAELDLRSASLKLRQLLGRPSSAEPLEVVSPLPPATARPERTLTIQTLEPLAFDRRADLRLAREAQARSLAELRLQEAEGKVDLIWGAEYRRQFGPVGYSHSLGLFLSVPIPLFNRNQGEIARASAEQLQAKRSLASVELNIRGDVRAALDEYESARGLVESIERDLLEPARNVRETVEYTYRAGASTIVELLDSQRAWNDTLQSYHQAQADYRRALAHLTAAVGTEVFP